MSMIPAAPLSETLACHLGLPAIRASIQRLRSAGDSQAAATRRIIPITRHSLLTRRRSTGRALRAGRRGLPADAYE